MNLFTDTFYSLSAFISLTQISSILRDTPFVYIISIALFCCVLLLINVFSRYKILSFKALIAWLCACGITLIYLVNANIELEKLTHALNSQVILSFFSSVILVLFYLLNLINKKPEKPKKNFGYNGWWISIVGFIVMLAFYCIFNIGLFVSTALLLS